LVLTEHKLERSKVKAPFDGLVISGDLRKRLGDYVKQGEALFEITPLDNYRIVLQVDDSRINDVAVGQNGVLVLAALPNQKFSFTVTKLTPQTIAEKGSSFFRVEAELATDVMNLGLLRPGMQGLAKISVDDRLLIGIWSRKLSEWIRLKLWAWSVW